MIVLVSSSSDLCNVDRKHLMNNQKVHLGQGLEFGSRLKPGLFASSALKTSGGLFSSGTQVQKGDGIISTSQASNNTLMVSAIIIIYVLAYTCRTANFIVIEVKVTEKILVKRKEDESRLPRCFARESDRFSGNSKELEVVDANFQLPS